MGEAAHQCPVCGKNGASRMGATGCSYCLLQLGLSSSGTASTVGSSRAATITGLGPSRVDRFLRQGVLPQFGDYELESEIARGGMGVVYRARQKSLNRHVAIKMILAGQLATPESVQRFRMEAEAAARLHHPGIVPIYEIGEFETQHFFSMELVDGESLAECLEEFRLKPDATPAEKRQQEQCIAELLAKVARALDFAHQRGVLHRDLKPSNILIDETGQPRLTDFGLAKLTGRESSGLTLSNAVLGTPGYLAPEQAAGRIDQVTTAADVYGLGATLYELLTGKPPFSGQTAVETMLMAVERTPAKPRQVNPSVHRDLETIALKCLEKAPERRYRSAAAVADELERFIRREPIHARPVGRMEHLWRWCQRNPGLAGMLCALIVVILAGSATVLWQWRRAEQANVELRETVKDLEWEAIDEMIAHGQTSRALAKVAALLRENPDDGNAATFAMSVLEQRKFPVPVAPTIRHPGGAELSIARLSPDGQRIVTASFDGTARIWDAATSQEVTPPLQHDGPVTWAAFSPDGRWLATGSQDKTVRLWEVATGKAHGEPVRHAEAVTEVRYSRDGRRLLTVTRNTVSILDAEGGRVLVGPIRHDGPIVAARFVGDGSSFLTAQNAGDKSSVRIWDRESGRETAALKTGGLRHADVSDDQRRVVLVDSRGRGTVADFPSGERRLAMEIGEASLQSAVFNANGSRIAVIGLNHWARVYDAQTALPLTNELPHYYLLEGVAFIGDGDRLLTWADDALAQVWDVAANKPACEPMRHAHRVMHAERGLRAGREVFLTAVSHMKSRSEATRTGAAQLWTIHDAPNPADRSFGTDPGYHDGSRISADGRLVAIGRTSKDIWIYDAATAALVCGPMPVNGGPWGMLFTPDCKKIIVTTSRGQVSAWSIPEGRPLGTPVELNTTIQPAEMTTDGRYFATGSTDGFARLWDTATVQPIHAMKHGAEINAIAFSQDGRWLASAGEDRVVRIWDTSTGKLARELTGHQNEVMAVFFSADGRRVVSASLDFTARLWDAATGQQQAVLPHQGEVIDANFSPDGRYVATASRDRTVVIWDAATGLPRSRGMLHEQGVRNLRFSPDGTRLLTVDFRGLRLWHVETGHPLTMHLPQIIQGGTGFQGSTTRANFAPDGRAVLLASDCFHSKLWHFSTPPAGAPAWFSEFLEAVAGQRLAAGSDRPDLVGPEKFLELQQRIRASTTTDYYTTWARAWLDAKAGQAVRRP